jgi:antitoxin YqcF
VATESGKAAARKVAAVFGGTPQIHRHYDVPEQHFIDILSCEDRPSEGLVSYSTLGLHLHPNVIDDVDVRVELCGMAPKDVPDFANVVATCAFNVIKDGWRCAPGIAHPDVVRMYTPDTIMRHIVFAEPFPWEELGTVHLPGDITAHWLMVVPISESEYVYMHEEGWGALEDLLEKADIDYPDLNRSPVV